MLAIPNLSGCLAVLFIVIISRPARSQQRWTYYHRHTGNENHQSFHENGSIIGKLQGGTLSVLA